MPSSRDRPPRQRVAIREVLRGHSEHRLPVARAAQGCRQSTVLGTGTARWIASICALHSSAARKPRAKPAPRASSTVRAGALKKGGSAFDQPGFDAGKLIKGTEAACSGRKACCCTASSPPPTARSRRRSRAAGESRLSRHGKSFADSVSGAGLSPRPGRHPAHETERQAIRSASSSSPVGLNAAWRGPVADWSR